MAEKDKELLLKDLCARLPYGVKGKIKINCIIPDQRDMDGFPIETTLDIDVELKSINTEDGEIFVDTTDENLSAYIRETQMDGNLWHIEEFTPYLRSMSNMTKEELSCAKELSQFFATPDVVAIKIDFYLEHHLDFRGLIPKGLALEAEKGMY